MGSKFTAEGIAKLFKRLGGTRSETASIAAIVMGGARDKLMADADSHTNSTKELSISTAMIVIPLVELCTLMNQDIEDLTGHVASLTARLAKLEGAEDG